MREDRRVQTLRQGLNVGQYKEILSRVKQATEAGEGLLPHERVRQDNSGFSRILGLMGNPLILQKNSKIFMDIEDEEKFLYGDEDDEHDQNKVLIRTESGSNAGIKDHSAVGSCRKQNRQSPPMTVTSETDRGPGTSQQHPPLDSCGPGETRERQDFVDFERIKKALQTIGLDLGVEEVIKMARMQERRAGPVTGSPQHKRASSLMNHSRSHSRSPSQSHTRKRNRSPNPEKYPASSPPTKQALCSGAPTGFVWSALDMDVQGKQVPFFEPDTLQPPVTVNMQPFPIVSEAAVLGHAQLQTANYWPQNPHFQSPHGPTMEHQVPSATDFAYERVHEKIAIGQLQGLGPLKQALASMKATTKASKMDTLVDFSKQSAQVRTGYLQRTPEQNAKVNEDGEALKAEIQVQLRRNESLMKELEVFLKQQGTEFLVPVMGFYCRLCEEFFGDITSAQDHATCDSHKEKCKKHADGHFKGRTILNFQGRSVDTDKQGLRQFDHKSRSKEESQGYRKDTEPVSVKEDKLETTRQVKVVSGPSSAKAVDIQEAREKGGGGGQGE
ncbi:hypothetical protein AAFF_G00140240 [Aldrovandia affinis]|uniref:C2H2-type domain-containing protein n=1 Tax=Aldrovandia affinis TaxID=143900 RepID=A0AAD7TCB6_9TELE|nr:hypothetical protein AAFF_G00140240 [Aldrovandia affinis]